MSITSSTRKTSMTLDDILNRPLWVKYEDEPLTKSSYQNLIPVLNKNNLSCDIIVVPTQEMADILIGYCLVTDKKFTISVNPKVPHIYRQM